MADNNVKEFILYMNSRWPSNLGELNKELLGLHGARERLTMYNGLLLYDARLYIPESLRSRYLELCHEGHQGIEKCRRRARRHFWWPGLSKAIVDYIERCDVCIMHSAIKHQPLQDTLLPSHPWEVIGSDIFVFQGELYVVMIDYYSKWIEAIHIRAQTSKEVIGVMKTVFARFGIPKVIRSDNGSCYASKEFRDFGKESGFLQATSSPRYPSSNGLAENAVKTVKRLWKKCNDKDTALSAYRTTPLETGFSPSDLMFGRAIRSNLGFPYESDIDYGQFEKLELARKRKVKRKWDKKHKAYMLPVLQPGQLVYVKAPTDVGAEGIVLRKDSAPESYWVRVGLSEVRRNRKHLFLLNSDTELSDSDGTTWYDDARHIADDFDPPDNEGGEEIVEPEVDNEVVEEQGVVENEPEAAENPAPVGDLENNVVLEADNNIEPVVAEGYVTRSGRVSRPPRAKDMVYY